MTRFPFSSFNHTITTNKNFHEKWQGSMTSRVGGEKGTLVPPGPHRDPAVLATLVHILPLTVMSRCDRSLIPHGGTPKRPEITVNNPQTAVFKLFPPCLSDRQAHAQSGTRSYQVPPSAGLTHDTRQQESGVYGSSFDFLRRRTVRRSRMFNNVEI